MKTIRIAVFLLMCLSAKSQYTITSVSPTQLKPGDTLTINFIYKGQPGSSQFNLGPLTGGGGQIWQYQNATFYSLPKTFNGADTIYTIKIKTPADYQLGESMISPDWKNGILLFFYEAVGIIEYTSGAPGTIYFDLTGNLIEKRYNEVIVEQIGTRRRKIYFQK